MKLSIPSTQTVQNSRKSRASTWLPTPLWTTVEMTELGSHGAFSQWLSNASLPGDPGQPFRRLTPPSPVGARRGGQGPSDNAVWAPDTDCMHPRQSPGAIGQGAGTPGTESGNSESISCGLNLPDSLLCPSHHLSTHRHPHDRIQTCLRVTRKPQK